MPESIDALYAFLAAGVVAALLVRPCELLARRIGAIDLPGPRSLHTTPTPRISGLAILAGVLVAGVIWLPADTETWTILAGALAIAAVGLVDDLRDLPPGIKLLGQIGAALIPVLGGVRIDVVTIPFVGGFEFGWLGYPLTVIGIVTVVNVINFIDGVDGLAAGVCAIAAAAFAIIAVSLDRFAAGILAAMTAGGALGYLRHGFPPATSFNAVVALALPLVVLAVPILDTAFVVAKRIKYRRPFYRADRSHFHHRMANIGFSQRRTLAYLYGWTLVLAGLALAMRFVPYSDDRGNFDTLWTVVMASCLLVSLAVSIYLVIVLEILKFRRVRKRNPETGEFERVIPPGME